MKKLPLVLLSIALILFAFSSCSNSTGTPAPSQEDIDAVKNGINVETILKDAFSGKDGIDVKYEYPQAKAAEEASIKAIATFNGYTSGSLQITAGRIEFVFKGAIDGTSFFATTYSAKTTARLEVSSGNGNPVPVSIDIPESANATAEVKATITDGVLSTTSIQVTINNLPESSTATITIADEEATTVTGSGNEADGGGATGGGGGGTVTPPGEEENPGTGEGGDDPVTPPEGAFEAPTPIFIEIDTGIESISTVSYLSHIAKSNISNNTSDDTSDDELMQKGLAMMQKMVSPAIMGFSGEAMVNSGTIDATIFGKSIKLNVEETSAGNFEYIYEDPTGNLSIKITYKTSNTGEVSFDFDQIRVFNNINIGSGAMNYYAITCGSDIKLDSNSNTWDGETKTYVLFGEVIPSADSKSVCSQLEAKFHSDENIAGYASYRTMMSIVNKDAYESITNSLELSKINDIISQIDNSIDMEESPSNGWSNYYQTVYFNKSKNEFGSDYASDWSWSKDGLISATSNNQIYEFWDLNSLPEPIPAPSNPETPEQA